MTHSKSDQTDRQAGYVPLPEIENVSSTGIK